MSTEIATIDPAEQQRLAEMMGAKKEQSGGVPLLKINLQHEDSQDRSIPAGSFFLTDQDTAAYAKTVKIRVLGQHYQYSEYDPDQEKVVNKTTINSSFRQEFLDIKGTTKCGMTKAKSKMDEGEAKRFKNVTCFRQLRVLVSYTGTTAGGEEVSIENQPAMMLLKGSNFMPFEEEVMKRMPKGNEIWDYWIDVSLSKHKNGSVTYYVAHFDADFSNSVSLDKDTIETIQHFGSLIEGENKRIVAKHNEAIRERTQGAALLEEGDDLEADVA
jgi:hypothetical protein